MQHYARRALSQLPEGFSEILMPQIMTAKEGSVDRWLVKEGDACQTGDSLCEVTLGDLTISVDAPRAGVVAEILLPAGQTIKVDEPILQLAASQDAYLAYLDDMRISEHDKGMAEEVAETIEDSAKAPDVKTLLREIRHLIDAKELDQERYEHAATSNTPQCLPFYSHRICCSVFSSLLLPPPPPSS